MKISQGHSRSSTQKVVPAPTKLSTPIRPPINLTILLTRESPNPEPDPPWSLPIPACAYGEKSLRSMTSAGEIPTPLSTTSILTTSRSPISSHLEPRRSPIVVDATIVCWSLRGNKGCELDRFMEMGVAGGWSGETRRVLMRIVPCAGVNLEELLERKFSGNHLHLNILTDLMRLVRTCVTRVSSPIMMPFSEGIAVMIFIISSSDLP